MEENVDDILKTKPYVEGEDSGLVFAKSNFVKTIPYVSHESAIGRPLDIHKTVPYSPDVPTVKRTGSHNIGVSDVVELNSIKYEILELLSEEGKTAEAIIYKVKDKDKRIFVLKLYYQFSDSHLEPNSDTLQRIREIAGKDILLLYDFGTGPNKYLEKFCFEVSAFAAGSDLLKVKDIKQKFTPEFIENSVVSAIHSGLCTMHNEKIYHCDLKPQNVFFLDEQQSKIVIGDYGSAKSFDKASEKDLSYTTMTKGTEFYLAPEQAFGIVSEKNDYYSLGMIVLHLLYPNQVTRQNLHRIFERRTKGLPIIDYNENFERLNKLIQGATLQDYNNRWGEAEIEAWLQGKEVSVNYGAEAEVSYLEIGELVIRTGKDLAKYIESDKRFFDHLIEDLEGYRMLMAWVKNMQGEPSMKKFDAMISHYKKYFGIDYVKEAMLFYFDPSHKISIGLEEFDFNSEKNTESLTVDFFKTIDTLWKLSDFDTLRLYFFKFEFALRRLRVKSDRKINSFIDKTLFTISEIIETSYTPDFSEFKAGVYINLRNKNLPELFHHFNQKRVFKDLRGNDYATLYEVCELLKANPPKSNDDYLQHEKAAFMMKASKDEFTEFVEFCNDIEEMYFRKDVDFELLIRQISKYSEKKYSINFLKETLLYYRKENYLVQRELILRLVDPETPVNVLGTNVFLYQHGNFQIKLDEFFMALDNVRINASYQEAVQVFFAFEFCLLQLSRNNNLIGKTLVEPVLAKINSVLHTNLPEPSKLRATLFKQINEKSLLDILYVFLPSRVFCTHLGDFLSNIEEIGLYYLQFHEQFLNQQSLIEREAYLNKSGNRGLINLDFEEFVMKVFQMQSTFDVNIKIIVFDENAANEVSFYYEYENSVNEYLASKGIKATYVSTSKTLNNLVISRKVYSSNDEIFESFATALRKKHTFGKLTTATSTSFEAAITACKKMDSRQSFFLLPRYLLYLLPAFGLVYLSLSYMLDSSIFKQISYNISPILNFVSVRMVTSNYGNLLFFAYFLNILIGILMLLPLLSLRRHKERYESFNENYSVLVSRLTLIMVFAPFLFIALYYFIEAFIEDASYDFSSIGLEINAISISMLLYILFMFYQVLIVIGAFFKVSKKIRLWPMLFVTIIYLIIGYYAVFYHNI